jgi:hypothetical protein
MQLKWVSTDRIKRQICILNERGYTYIEAQTRDIKDFAWCPTRDIANVIIKGTGTICL